VTGRRDGAVVARWLAERVREVAPPGLGRWGPAWELVEEPSTRFLDALSAWEASGAEADKERVRLAAGGVVAAWREAARQYEAERARDASRPAHVRVFRCVDGCGAEVGGPDMRCGRCVVARHREREEATR